MRTYLRPSDLSDITNIHANTHSKLSFASAMNLRHPNIYIKWRHILGGQTSPHSNFSILCFHLPILRHHTLSWRCWIFLSTQKCCYLWDGLWGVEIVAQKFHSENETFHESFSHRRHINEWHLYWCNHVKGWKEDFSIWRGPHAARQQ